MGIHTQGYVFEVHTERELIECLDLLAAWPQMAIWLYAAEWRHKRQSAKTFSVGA